MNELITITTRALGGGETQTVSARDLHAFLEVRKDFSTWVKSQVERARLIEGRDFFKEIPLPQKGELENQRVSNAIQGRIEYHLSLDAAKHIAMMSGTEKGYLVRDYFIECERRAHQVATSPEQVLVSLGVDPISAKILVENRKDINKAMEQSTRALELATIAEAKAQASALACMDYSIMAYARLLDIPLPLTEAMKLGRRSAALSRERGLPMGEVRDPRWGSVHTYMETVLDEVFNEYLSDITL